MVTQKDIDKQLQEWAVANKYELNKGPAQIEADKKIQAYRDYLVAKSTAEDAPQALEAAKTTYLEKMYGSDYDTKRDIDYEKEGKEVVKSYLDEHTERMNKVNKAYTMYEAVAKFSAQSVQDYEQSLNLHVANVQASSSSAEFQTTTKRKTYYLNEERNTLEWWDTAATLLIVSVSLVFAYDTFFINRNFKNLWLWFLLLLMLLASYLLPIIVRWVVNIQQPVNVYSSWAQSGHSEWHGNDL